MPSILRATCDAGCSHYSFTVKSGLTYLLRIINAGTLTYQTLCFEVRCCNDKH